MSQIACCRCAGSSRTRRTGSSPPLAPRPPRLTKSLWFENEARVPRGSCAATERPMPGPPRRPPTAAAGNSSGLPFVAPCCPRRPPGSTSLKKARSSARACVAVKRLAGEAQVEHVGAAAHRTVDARDESATEKPPSVEARTGSTWCCRRRPCRRSRCRRSRRSGRPRTCRGRSVGHVVAAADACRSTRRIRPARSGWPTSSAGVDHGDRCAPSRRRPRRGPRPRGRSRRPR